MKDENYQRGHSPLTTVLWEGRPGHFDAFSKMPVRPQNAATNHFDCRVSSYQPNGYVASHSPKVQEQIYHNWNGEGLMEIEGEHHVVGPRDTIFIPPGVGHAIYNTGHTDLIYVVTSPPEDF